MTVLGDQLERARTAGRKLLIPYVMAGIPTSEDFDDAFTAIAAHADAVEIGLPYSDPLMDGPAIAAAGARAIAGGTGPRQGLELAGAIASDVPRLAMTYYNPIHRMGEAAFCAAAVAAGITGVIVPDLPLEESTSLRAAVAKEGLAWVPLVAPTSSPERVAALTATCTGFVYAVSTLGVTGTRESLSERAAGVVRRCREATDLPIIVGVGISTPAQAVEATREADGVVIGSAVVTALLEAGPRAAGELLAAVRTALDGA